MFAQVIIIGGGMAGIKTAIDLLNAGVTDVLILESRDRLGGRLVSVPSTKNPSVCYDLGALWFHDALINPLYAKAKKLGNVRVFYDDGKHRVVSESLASVPEHDIHEIMMEMRAFAGLLYSENPLLPDMSVQQLSQLYLERQKSTLTEHQMKYAPQLLRTWDEMWGGVLWDKVSVKQAYLAEGEDHVGRNAFVCNGYRTVFENELNELPVSFRKSRIKLNVTVETLDYSDPTCVSLTTANGDLYKSQYVVVTIPFNALSSAQPMLKWTPALPQHLALVFSEDTRGLLGKVILEFDKCFWPKDIHRFYCLASNDDPSGEPRPWKHPTLIVNYYAMTQIPSMVFLTQDPLSSQIETMSKQQIWHLFKPVVEQIATGPIEEPIGILNTPWNKDPLTQGSYTMARVGCSSTSFICGALAKGVNKMVRFAGSETWAGSANGCAHGAWYSGEREAAHIIGQICGIGKSRL